MIDMRYKPRHLPQVNAPFTKVASELDNEEVGYEEVEMKPEDLNPMQGVVLANEVGGFNDEEMDPIWISKDNDVIDGHHRWVRKLMAKEPIQCYKIDLNGRDGARVLNKIQDLYEYEQQQGMEEVVLQDVINDENDQETGIESQDFLSMLESDLQLPEGNAVNLVAYRKEPIKENSAVGNYFVLEPSEGFSKYQIEFDNLLDTEQLGLNCDGDCSPVETVANAWFPHVDFDKFSEESGVPAENLKNKAIAEKANKMGYDGIKYGGTLLQGLK